ncbi:unnamed protein product, partial [Ascophyllum nodosum]
MSTVIELALRNGLKFRGGSCTRDPMQPPVKRSQGQIRGSAWPLFSAPHTIGGHFLSVARNKNHHCSFSGRRHRRDLYPTVATGTLTSDGKRKRSGGGGIRGRTSTGIDGDSVVQQTWSQQLRAFIRRSKELGAGGRWREVLRLLDLLARDGRPLNSYTYNSAISSIAKSGRWREALSVRDRMVADGIKVDSYTFSAL